ncbi:MAG: radical SAM protein [Bacteroidales bacterium]|nr:radical SAM protein [Bacteroidales bacterium]
MSTVLYPDIIFGPVHSRRLGLSLGINLLPIQRKFCTFDCVYCECGLGDMEGVKKLPTADQLETALRTRLEKMRAEGQCPDVLTFAGNGEPTLHPEFPEIVERVRKVRDELFPTAKISVLSNATQIGRPEIRQALLRVDNNILKLDSAFEETMRQMNRPWRKEFSVATLVENLKAFQGRLIIQTMFLRGTYQGRLFDNTTEQEVSAWIRLVTEIAPHGVMIYSLDREAPVSTLEKIPAATLRQIGDRLQAATRAAGLEVKVSVAG